jgi:hypothetical protein
MLSDSRMMNGFRALAVTMGMMASCVVAFSEGPPPTFDGAKWIWYSREPMPLSQSFPAGAHYFRAALTLPERTQVKSAELIITADNLYTFHINGKLAGESHANPNAWAQPKRFNVATLVCFVLFRTRGCGCGGHPAFPAPSVFLGRKGSCKTRAHWRCGRAESYPSRSMPPAWINFAGRRTIGRKAHLTPRPIFIQSEGGSHVCRHPSGQGKDWNG